MSDKEFRKSVQQRNREWNMQFDQYGYWAARLLVETDNPHFWPPEAGGWEGRHLRAELMPAWQWMIGEAILRQSHAELPEDLLNMRLGFAGLSLADFHHSGYNNG